MDYRQLLNPKGFAKEKQKGKQQDKGRNDAQTATKSSDSNPPNTKPSVPRFDPKALLNPKAAASRPKAMESDSPETTVNGGGDLKPSSSSFDNVETGMTSMIERVHGVTNREMPLKRKSADVEGNDEDTQKKPKTGFSSGASSGILGEHLKAEREKAGAVQSIEPIDLTNDDDNDEDEVIFVGETSKPRADDNQEVCLGRLFAKANAFRIPVPPRNQNNVLGDQLWPQMRINFKRLSGKTNVIDLFDRSGGDTGTKFAMMDIQAAAALCPLLDGSEVSKLRIKIFVDPFPRRDGEFPGMKVSKLLSLSILLYAPRGKADAIGRVLSQKNQFLTQPPTADRNIEYFNPQDPTPLGGIVKKNGARKPQSSQPSYVTRTLEEMKRDASNVFDELSQHAENLVEMEPNTSIISTPLMEHQKQALQFLVQHEHNKEASGKQGAIMNLWKEKLTHKGTMWYNIITNHEVNKKPEPERGGILADMMGLGKTLSVLSLIANTLDESRAFGTTEPPVDAVDVECNAKTTLIICPKSVMSNWEEQIKLHTRAKKLELYSYHGTSRIRDPYELAKFDIILTTYSTAAAEFGDKRDDRNTLSTVQWFRIVLDEGHQIRTSSTKVAQACCALSADRRWVVTGTPVQNRLDDLGSLIRFLRIKPFDDKESWARYILAPFRNGDKNVLTHFRVLVDSITLRRQKDKIGLKERRENIIRLDFSDKEREAYTYFANVSSSQLKLMLGRDSRLRGKSYAHVLRSLGRLRMICAHGREMLDEEEQKRLDTASDSIAIDLGDEPGDGPDESFITEKHAYDALHMMSESDVDICICCNGKIGDKKADPDAVGEVEGDEDPEKDEEESDDEDDSDTMGYLTPCYHLICPNCRDGHVEQASMNLTEDHYHNCAYCEQYTRFGLFELRRSGLKAMLASRNKVKGKKSKWDESTYSGPHTKVTALMEDLKKSAVESAAFDVTEPPIRSVVFSGWTTYLDLIGHALEENDIKFVRLDGSMSLTARRKVLRDFKTEPFVTVLLVSIKAGGQGLNFTAANKVYMMEPQFNPGVELQAIDRVHRLGQKRDVDIIHYIMRDSVEEKILKLQEKKQKLAEMSMEKKLSRSEESNKKIEELKELFK